MGLRKKRMIYIFQCPICQKKLRTGSSFEPCCTGPSENRDDHPMQVMRLLQVQKVEINPLESERKATGPLILPPGFKYNL